MSEINKHAVPTEQKVVPEIDNHAAPACRIDFAQPDRPVGSEPSILSAKAPCGKKPGNG